jgi:hypothetical protein
VRKLSVVLLLFAFVPILAQDTPPSPSQSTGDSPSTNRTNPTEPPAKTVDPKLAKHIRELALKIDQQLKLSSKTGKRTSDNYFVVGYAEVKHPSKKLEVKFDVLKSVKGTATEIVEFMAEVKPGASVRDYRVYSRHATKPEAEKSLKARRDEFDAAEATRKKLMAQYQATSVKRC